jgi:CRISPR type III-A-associated RAMP protein Csm5
MKYSFRTLTPLHVGDGSTLHSFDYVVHEGLFYRVSQRIFEKFLENTGGDIAERFVSWSTDLTFKIDNAERDRRNNPRGGDYNQELSRLRKSFNLYEFAKTIGKERVFIAFLQTEKVPVMPMPQVAKGEPEKQEVRGFQRNGFNQPFLPGSSIKGSLRTALLYHFLEEHASHEDVRRILKDALEKIRFEKADAERKKFKFNTERHRKSFADRIEYLAFFSGMIDERGKQRDGEAQDDLLKCLLVSDIPLSGESVGIDNIDLYLVKKLPKGQGMEAQRQRQAPAAEVILPGNILNLDIAVNIPLLLHLHRSKQTNDKGIVVGKECHFIGWRERCKTLFGLNGTDFDTVKTNAKYYDPNLKALEGKAVKHIIECCQRFTAVQAEALARWSNHFQKHDRGGMARPMDTGMSTVLNAKGARLHMGYATGFEGVTAVIHFLAFHKPVFSEIMELFGIGDSPSAWKNRRPGETYRANPDQFPKSRRLITRAGAILPMGWMEWADDPNTQTSSSQTTTAHRSEPVPDTKPAPKYMRGTLKQGTELEAELVGAGNPGRYKLFIREGFEPIIDVKYPAGFKSEDVGRLAIIRVKNIKGKEEVTIADFVRFK